MKWGKEKQAVPCSLSIPVECKMTHLGKSLSLSCIFNGQFPIHYFQMFIGGFEMSFSSCSETGNSLKSLFNTRSGLYAEQPCHRFSTGFSRMEEIPPFLSSFLSRLRFLLFFFYSFLYWTESRCLGAVDWITKRWVWAALTSVCVFRCVWVCVCVVFLFIAIKYCMTCVLRVNGMYEHG